MDHFKGEEGEVGKKKYQWDEAYLFGSLILEGRFRQNSDIDIAVLGLKKYDYYKNRITSTEDFILYSATKSTMSGEPYRVICNGKSMHTAEWLKEELAGMER